jgi:phosphoribosyl-AMP cyclohydrolase
MRKGLTENYLTVYEEKLFLLKSTFMKGYSMITLDFEKMGGLIPAIIQDHETGEVLMLAYMDEKTLNLTLETGKTWFFSRSRNKYWMKGEQDGSIPLSLLMRRRAAQILSSSSPGPMLVPLVTMPKQPEPFCSASPAALAMVSSSTKGKIGASVT